MWIKSRRNMIRHRQTFDDCKESIITLMSSLFDWFIKVKRKMSLVVSVRLSFPLNAKLHLICQIGLKHVSQKIWKQICNGSPLDCKWRDIIIFYDEKRYFNIDFRNRFPLWKKEVGYRWFGPETLVMCKLIRSTLAAQ